MEIINWCNKIKGKHNNSCCICFFKENDKISIVYRTKKDNYIKYQEGDGKKLHSLCRNCYNLLKKQKVV